MPPWYAWLGGVLVVRAVWSEVSPVLAVALGAAALICFWSYRLGTAAIEGHQGRGRLVAGRHEARRILSEIGDVMLGWGLILVGLLALGGAIVLWVYAPLADIALVVILAGLVLLAIRHRGSLRESWRELEWDELRGRLRPVLETWERHALSTTLADHMVVERRIAEIYARREKTAPRVEWASSPLTFDARRRAIKAKPLHRRPPPFYWSTLVDGTAWHVWMHIWSHADRDLEEGLPLDDFSAALAAADGAPGLYDLVRNTSWFAFYEDTALVLERPSELHVDADGLLHNPAGPAVTFADGWAIWALEGVLVPSEVIEDPDGYDARAALRTENVEVRRVVLEHLGWERVIRASGLRPIAEDEHGRLWTIPVEGAEALVLLEVLDATVRADGDQRRYVLRVPPTVRTPREAAAWTFGLSEHEYAPDASS
jgi:hypothetical protein